jgi:hypothetical protein
MKYNFTTLAKNTPKFLLLIYIILKPFYLFHLGLPQIAEYLIVILIAFHLIINRPTLDYKKKNIIFLWSFFLVIAIINAVYSMYYTLPEALTFWWSTIFYGFNIIFFIVAKEVFKSFKTLDYKWLLIVCIISMCIQFCLYLVEFDKELPNNFFGRRYLFFNNPNQLAYYSLLLVTLILLIEKKIKTLRYLIPILISLACILTFFSSSRPVIFGMILLVFYYFIFILNTHRLKSAILFLVPLLFICSVHFQKVAIEFKRTFSRFARVENNQVKEYSNRGYERIYESPEYFLYGAGEGNLERFMTPKNNIKQEIHNTAANLLFSYGFVGLLLFILFIYFSIRYLSWRQLWLFIPLVMYHMFHNGIRFSFLWLFLAIVFQLNEERKQLKILK